MGKPVPIANPSLGINEDAEPGALSPNEAVQMVNLLPHNPSQLERRGPYVLADVDSSRGAAEFPVGIAINGTKALVTWVTDTDAVFDDPISWSYYYSDETTQAQAPNFTSRAGRVWTQPAAGASLDTSSADVAVTNYTNDTAGTPDRNVLLPYTRSSFHEGVTYFNSIFPENTYAKIASAPTLKEGTRLVAWAGANKAAVSTTGTVNVGATAITFGASQTNLENTFVTFDSDRTTTVPFAYRIISGSGTNWVLEKPYGLGESAAANKAGANCQIRSRDIPIQSPAGCVVSAAHLDRLFVGRAFVRDAVGTLQPAYYANALKWSQALSPEKWPDANVALVGSEPNDAISGMISHGRYLLVFKFNSVWVLAGDSEENFTLRKIAGDYGCIDSRSIVEHNDTVIWASRKGIHRITRDLEIDELTQRKPGHGVRRTYQYMTNAAFAGSVPSAVSMCVDSNDYLHVLAVQYEPHMKTYLTDLSDSTLNPSGTHYYRKMPMSCHIPTKSWTRLQGTQDDGTFRAVASPRLMSCEKISGLAFAAGREGYLYMDLLTNPHGSLRADLPGAAVSQGSDYVSNGAGGETAVAFAVDVTYPDMALAGFDTWQLSKLQVAHQVVYFGSTDANTTGAEVAAFFDPVTSHAASLTPSTELGAFKARETSDLSAKSTYVSEINPRTSSDEEALRGMFLRLRVYDQSTAPTDHWKIFQITAVIDPGRPGRATDPLL